VEVRGVEKRKLIIAHTIDWLIERLRSTHDAEERRSKFKAAENV
jgi:hypothetical protein